MTRSRSDAEHLLLGSQLVTCGGASIQTWSVWNDQGRLVPFRAPACFEAGDASGLVFRSDCGGDWSC